MDGVRGIEEVTIESILILAQVNTKRAACSDGRTEIDACSALYTKFGHHGINTSIQKICSFPEKGLLYFLKKLCISAKKLHKEFQVKFHSTKTYSASKDTYSGHPFLLLSTSTNIRLSLAIPAANFP